jgi:hypothetical protein
MEFTTTLVRNPITLKSDDWQKASHQWLVTIGNQNFDYYTGIGHRTKFSRAYAREYGKMPIPLAILLKYTKPTRPTFDDVLSCLLTDSLASETSFSNWCGDFGYDDDSIKALDIYRGCCESAKKLRLAGVDIAAEKIRLQDY